MDMYTNHGSAVIICQEHGAYASFELSCLIAHFLFCTTGNSSTYIKETRVLAYLYMSMGDWERRVKLRRCDYAHESSPKRGKNN